MAVNDVSRRKTFNMSFSTDENEKLICLCLYRNNDNYHLFSLKDTFMFYSCLLLLKYSHKTQRLNNFNCNLDCRTSKGKGTYKWSPKQCFISEKGSLNLKHEISKVLH